MRSFAMLAAAAVCAAAQQPPFTLDQILGYSFPTDLTAAPTGGKVAWVSNRRGVRNIMVSEPPRYQPRKLTAYTQDDGQELRQLRWLPDSSAIVYTRGGSANPTLNPNGVSEDLWLAALDGSAPRKLAQGSSPAVSPKGDTIAFTLGNQIWLAAVDGKTSPRPAFQASGMCANPTWSPDGDRIAFTTDRGDHTFIGVYHLPSAALRYLDPATADDMEPAWSPDGRSIAFIRLPSNGLRPVREAQRAGQPWSIRIASAETGAGRELWRASEGRGSVFRAISAAGQLLWTADGRIVFPWEGDGWTHLYSIPIAGGRPTLLTPGAYEVEHVAPDAARREVIFSANRDDIDRRHLFQVAAAGGSVVPITNGNGIEVAPAPTSDENALAFLASDARHPVHPAIRIGAETRDLDPGTTGGDFPLQHVIAPQPVVFSAADGLLIHGQLFLPPRISGRAPAVVFFHGGPRRQMLLGWHYMYYYANAYALNQYLANAGYIVLSVNFRSGIGYGLDFREALHYGASGASDYNDVQGAGVYLRSRQDVDPARIGVWGGSYGGYLTAMALARASDLFKCGVDFHGVHNWATELGIPPTEADYKIAFQSSPLNFVDDWRSPVLLIHGDADPDVQFNQTVRLAFALQSRNVEVEELIIPGEVHDFLLYRSWHDTYAAAVAFFKRKL
jgi:dipeptidyl aminopeptidase/acylaminoacyl peptidase